MTTKMKSKTKLPKPVPLGEICEALQTLQRKRSILLKSRIMQVNRLRAIVATASLGYSTRLTEKERSAKFAEAEKHIQAEMAGEQSSDMEEVIKTTMIGIEAFQASLDVIEQSMEVLAKKLPVAEWVLKKPERRGIGLHTLAVIVGECGNLDNYSNPAKVWARLGCAPYSYGGQTWMGATWRSGKQGKLPAEEWEKFGYSPRRRCVAYLIGEGIVKQNGDGIYRARYDEAKEKIAALHPDYNKTRCHLHGMLLATKLFLKDLWREWRKDADPATISQPYEE